MVILSNLILCRSIKKIDETISLSRRFSTRKADGENECNKNALLP